MLKSALRARWFMPAGAGVLLLCMVGYLWSHDPHAPDSHLPPCPIRATTGLLCPGCGGLRASWHLLHGDVAGAWQDNPAIFLLLPLLGAGFIYWSLGRLRTGSSPRLPRGVAVGFGLAGISWMVVRNIAFGH